MNEEMEKEQGKKERNLVKTSVLSAGVSVHSALYRLAHFCHNLRVKLIYFDPVILE